LLALASLTALQRAVAADAGLSAALTSSSLLPRSLADVAASARLLRAAAAAHGALVFAAFSAAYFCKAALCLPGTMVLNALAGVMYGRVPALVAAAALGVAGSVNAFALSAAAGPPLLARCGLEARLASLRGRVAVAARRGGFSLVAFLVGARMTVPQWLYNGLSPHAGVPLSSFILGSLVGSLPYALLTTAAGAALAEAAAAAAAAGSPLSVGELFSAPVVASFAAFALVCFAPALYLRFVAAGGGGSDARSERGDPPPPPPPRALTAVASWWRGASAMPVATRRASPSAEP
jgi:uncharacterized membrane protein YdjX (TVP38/TMEM64 family)